MLSFWTDTKKYLPYTKVMQVHIGIEKKGNLRHEISRIEAGPPKCNLVGQRVVLAQLQSWRILIQSPQKLHIFGSFIFKLHNC